MWVRKTKAEIVAQQHRERFGIAYPALGALMLTGMISFLNWAGFVTWSGFMYPRQSLAEVAAKSPFWFAGIFVFVYLSQILASPRRRRYRSEPLICRACRTTVTGYPAPIHCSCGGPVEPLRYWHWVEDEHPVANT